MLNQKSGDAERSLDIVSVRIFEGRCEAVFEAFRDSERLAQWWGPKGFRNTFHERDFRPGGDWRFTMHGPDGAENPMHKQFIEIVAPERVVYRNVHATHGFTMFMTFAELDEGERTQLTWRMRFDSDEEARAVREIVLQGNEQNFDRLAAHLASSS
jgi:uncharacterized protein YndB with AHSA1/START domain